MDDILDIPAEMRWEIAARSAVASSLAYGAAFQKALRDRFDEISLQIWAEGGKEANRLADMLGLRTGNAAEVDNAWSIISGVLFGSELKWHVVESGSDITVSRITGCPFLNAAKEMGLDAKECFKACQAYCRSSVESINSSYTQWYVSGMCLGAPYCESIVELKK